MSNLRVVPFLVAGFLWACGDDSNPSNNDQPNNTATNNTQTNNSTNNNSNNTSTNNTSNNSTNNTSNNSTNNNSNNTTNNTTNNSTNNTTNNSTNNTTNNQTNNTNPDPISFYTQDYNTSGTRLTAIAVEDVHGNSRVAWFYDNDLNKRCSVRKAADNTMRCLPEANPMPTTFGTVYTNATCTTAGYLIGDSCPSLNYHSDENGRYYTLGGYFPTAYQIVGQGCTTVSLPQDQDLVSLNEVPPTTFVEFTRSHLPVTTDFGVEVFNGADGSRFVNNLWDIAAAQPARFSNNRIIPYYHSISSDGAFPASCGSSTGGFVGEDVGYTPTYVLVYGESAMGGYIEYFFPITGVQDTFCNGFNNVSVGAGYRFFLVNPTAPKQFTDFPEAKLRGDMGAGIRTQHVATMNDEPLMPWLPRFGDSVVFDGATYSVAQKDGALRRMPSMIYDSTLYTDSNCRNLATDPGLPIPAGSYFAEFENQANPRTCNALRDTPNQLKSLWERPASNGGFGAMYIFNGSQCISIGNQPGLGLTNVTDQIDTIAPILPTVEL